jgi:ATP-dependent RNA helicase SUPV3L1/SUV3
MSSFTNSGSRAPGAGVTAVLGPTNTGKTHLAIERMLAHSSGIIGLPLRLLAREVYNKIVDRIGPAEVALVTGEEKIKPERARYWVSTVEAMPRDLDVSFVAIDEIQLASDLERGHVFTDRILHRRGRDETLILGAATMRGIVERLLPGVNVVTRPRLSQLSFSGDRKLTRQPRRTAIVAFSADEVYAIAELIRRQRGGAAVVLGSLSPRTRNAQVAMYQNGDVDYLVATDAIGMGLNLDVDHVAFASDSKYDGYQFRRLTPSEFAQIAGRAGRAARDGTFGTTGRCAPFEPELVDALQKHAFDSVKVLQWRNTSLDFSSIGALQATLAQTPNHEALTRAPTTEDIRVLDHAARDEDIRAMARDRASVERLWEVCQIPDYRRVAPAAHAELITALYGFLMQRGTVPTDWFAAQVAQADRTDGDIDTLSARIAHIRTWTFAANRPDWLADPEHWQQTARAVEDRLSDALHERLTERFVDRRTSVLMRRLRENTMLDTEIGATGEVIVEGHSIGRLDGFVFAPDTADAGSEARALQAAAQKALAGEIDARAEKLAAAADTQFVLSSDGTLRWIGAPVAKLMMSEDALRPRLRLVADERLTGAPRDNVQARCDLWLKTHIEKLLGPLFDLAKAEDITGMARGIAFQLVEALGVLERAKVANDLKALDQPARATLRKYGVRFGAYHIYLPALLKPAPRSLASLLWSLKQDNLDPTMLAGAQQLAGSGRTSFPIDPSLSRDLYRTLGYRVAGERAVRVDILERLADLIRPALSWRPASTGTKPAGSFDGSSFVVTPAMMSLTGSAGEDFASILRALGYRMERRPKPPEAAKPEAPAVVETLAEAAVEQAIDAAAVATNAPGTDTVAEIDATPVEEAASVEAVSVETPAPEAAIELEVENAIDAVAAAPQPQEQDTQAAPEAAASETIAAEGEAATEVTAPAEPELIEVWRAGRPTGERPARRPHRRHEGRQGQNQAQTQGQKQGGGEAQQGERKEGEGEGQRDGEHRRHRRRRHGNRPQEPQQPAGDVAAQSAAPSEQAATEAPQRDQHQRGPRREGQRHEGRRDGGKRFEGKREGKRDGNRQDNRQGKFEGNRRDNNREFPPRREQRDRPMDPNSPFAKLAALKAQLEAKK